MSRRRSRGKRGEPVESVEPVDAKRMRAFRLPAIVVILGLLIAAVIYERDLRGASAPITSAELANVMPVASSADALSTTWFCAAGTARGNTRPPDPTLPDARTTVVAEHTVVITNQSERVQRARVTVYPSEGSPVVKVFDLSARARFDLILSDVVRAPFAAALIETDGGLVAVEHVLDGPVGHAGGPCASSAGTSWYFPSGTTRPGARLIYAVFNPFPDQAVLDFDFQVEDDNGRQVARETDKLRGIVVKPGQIVPVDITDVIQVRPRLATRVQVRGNRGRVVIDQLLVEDGEHKHDARISVGLGASTPMDSWLFPDGEPAGPGVETNIVLYNPGTETVEADVFVNLDVFFNLDGSVSDIDPFTATVRAGQYLVVSLTDDGRLPEGVGYWAVAHSRKGGPIIATREQTVSEPATRPGVSANLGSPLLATQWIVPLGGSAATASAEVSIANPSSINEVTLTVHAVVDGTTTPIDQYDQVVLPPGGRTVVDLNDPSVPGAPPARALRIEATGPVLAGQSLSWTDPDARAALIVFPVRDTLSLPDASILGPDLTSPTAPQAPEGLGTIVPGDTLPGTSIPAAPGTGVAPPGTDVDGQPITTTVPEPPADPAATAATAATDSTLPVDGATDTTSTVNP